MISLCTLNAVSTICINTGYDQKIFALALNPTGSQLLFSTFLSSGNTPSVAVDSKANTYVAGNTTSYQFPAEPYRGQLTASERYNLRY